MTNNSRLSVSDAEFWNEKYLIQDTGWDLKGPTPAFNDWIQTQVTPLRICVLGCGNGYDAVNFARFGHDVYGVDFAENAIKRMMDLAKTKGVQVKPVLADIFRLPEKYNDFFHVVIEYTCYCAIDPQRRREYLDVVHRILKPGGKLVGLLFPINKPESEWGPPFRVDRETTVRFFEEKFTCLRNEFPDNSIKPRKGNEVFVEFVKE